MLPRQDSVVQVQNLRKLFDRFALNLPSLEIGQGEVVGLIGENGAGKSTLIKLLLGIIPKDSGEILLFGEGIQSPALRERIGVSFDQCWFSDVLSLSDVEKIMRNLYPYLWNTSLFFRVAKRFGLPEGQRIAEYSSGMKAKLGILSAICHAPDLLILDEPTNSLDPVMRRDVNRTIREFAEMGGKTVLFSSHIVNELEEFADRILFMKDGHIVLDSKVSALQTDYCVGTVPEADFLDDAPSNALAMLREGGKLTYLLRGRPQGRWEAVLRTTWGVSLDELMYFYERGERA